MLLEILIHEKIQHIRNSDTLEFLIYHDSSMSGTPMHQNFDMSEILICKGFDNPNASQFQDIAIPISWKFQLRIMTCWILMCWKFSCVRSAIIEIHQKFRNCKVSVFLIY